MLGVLEADLAATDLTVQLVLEPVLLVRARMGCGGLGKEVRLGVRSAELERDQMVDLAVLAVEVGVDAVGGVDGVLRRARDMADGARVARPADLLARDAREA